MDATEMSDVVDIRGRTGAATAAAGPTWRFSRVSHGTRLVFADLHNHSLLSDGTGDPAEAFASMQRSGIEVAAFTEHARMGAGLKFLPCGDGVTGHACRSVLGID